MIPRFRPMIGADEFFALLRPSNGAVEEFESEFAAQFDTAGAIAFPYGRSALWAMLKAIGLNDADVITPPYTCSVVAHAITLSGNRPKFVDIQLHDYNMDLERLADAIDQRTHAIVATHIFGYPLDIDQLDTIVKQAENRFGHKIWVIQDCAHSFNASWQGRPVAAAGDAALYGLNISKVMTSIFGGMLTVPDETLAARIRDWRDEQFREPAALKSWRRRLYLLAVYAAFHERLYGLAWWLQNKTPILDGLTQDYHLDDKIHFPPDFLDRMIDIEAAIGRVQLKKYDRIIELRRRNASWYEQHLPRNKDFILPPIVDGATYSHYVVRTERRDALIHACAKDGVELGRVIDYSVPDLESYKSAANCPNSTIASHTVLNLPLTVDTRGLRRVLRTLQKAM